MTVSDLTGYTWVANSSVIGERASQGYQINFNCNSQNYIGLRPLWIASYEDALEGFVDGRNELQYMQNEGTITVIVAATGQTGTTQSPINSWTNDAYKTIIITGGDDVENTNLIAWLEANGTLTAPAPAEPLTSSFNETSVVDNSAYLSLYINGVEFKLEKGTASVSLISFYVNPPIVGEVAGYQAESGMTWAEWVASTYNTAGFFINNNEIINANGNWRITVQLIPVRGSDTITENFTYDQSSYGGGR